MKLRGYPEYKDTGLIWIGEIPSQWKVKRIKHNTYVKGRIGWQGLKSDEFVDEGPYLVTGTDFNNGDVNWDSAYHVSEERYREDSYIQLKENDLLITKDGTIGKVAIVKNLPGPATLNSGIFVTRPVTDDYITTYLYWILNSAVFDRFIDITKTGTTISHLYQNVFVEFSFPIPTIQEQNTIAAFLDRETARIDQLIAKKERQIELLQEKRFALISHTVTKGLNPDAKMKDSGIEWLGEIPEHWSVAPLYAKYDLQLGKMLDSKRITGKLLAPYLRNIDVQWGGINVEDLPLMDFTPEDRERFSLQPSDLLVCEGGDIGRTAVWQGELAECYYQKALHRLRPLQNNCSRYFYYLMCAATSIGVFQAGSDVSTIGHLTGEKLCRQRFPFPPNPEQEQIVKYLDKAIEEIDIISNKVKNGIKILNEYRAALISAAVTGKIDVREEAA